jgi:lysophospholipase L1-like esterase
VLILGLFLELSLRIVTAWKEPKGRFMWMLGRNRLHEMGQRDGYRFFTGRKGQTVEHGAIRIEFNNLGFRSKEREILPKGDDRLRVVCFGDSVTLGQYMRDYYDTWPGAIERVVNASPTPKRVEVLNFGMAHYTYTTNLVNLALIGEYVKPDIAVFLIGPNDFVCLYTRNYEPDGSHDGQWLLPVADATWGFHPIGNILQHSRVCNLVFGSLAKFIVFLEAAKLFNYGLSEEDLASRLDKMADHLASFCTLSRALGATPVLCTYVYDEQRLWERRGEEFQHVLDGIDDTIRKVAEREGAVLVEANDEMKDHREYFLDDFHMSAAGGDKFAQVLVKALRDRHGLLPETDAVPARTESEE